MSSHRKIAIGHVETAGSNLDSVHTKHRRGERNNQHEHSNPVWTHGLPLH